MPAKIARLATRPPFWIPEVSVAVCSSRPSCSKAEKREYSWQIGSHPGNLGYIDLSRSRCYRALCQSCQRDEPKVPTADSAHAVGKQHRNLRLEKQVCADPVHAVRSLKDCCREGSKCP
jgi:hypothetical protein